MVLPVLVDAAWAGPQSMNGQEMRRADAAMFGGDGTAIGVPGGIVRHGDTSLAVTVSGADVVTVQPGAVVIPGNFGVANGVYRTALPAADTGNLVARSATLPRMDRVVFRVMDTDVVATHGAYTGKLEVLAGTPNATPLIGMQALPTLAVEVGRITVPIVGGGAATVDSSFRKYVTAVGGRLPVGNAAQLPAAAAKWDQAIALDSGTVYTWDGAAWTAGGWTPYVPTWPSAANVLGNGVLAGAYDVPGGGKAVHFRSQLTFGSTTVISNNAQTLSLPFPIKAGTFPVFMGEALDVSAGGTAQIRSSYFNASEFYLLVPDISAGGFDRPLRAGAPFAWATGDRITVNGTYERA